MVAYFLGSGPGGLIKIGHAVDPVARLAGLQKRSAARLAILAVDAEGDWLTEADLHWRFGYARLRSEWFEPCPGVLAAVAWMAETGRAPNVWYLPPHIKAEGRWPTSLPGDEIAAKFKLTRARLRMVAPEHTVAAALGRCKLLLPAIPMIRDVLRADGVACCVADFFPPAPSGHA